VQDAANKQFILSNNHVMARLNEATTGEDIVQPGLMDVGCQPTVANSKVVAELSAFATLLFGSGRQAPLNTIDAAIAETRAGAVRTDGSIMDIGTLSNLTAQDRVGCQVQKSGRTTGLTKGTIAAVDITVNVRYGGDKVARFTDQFAVEPGTFGAPGDSGSLIARDGATPRAVGLLFAGSRRAVLGNPIGAVLGHFGVTMVGSGDGTGDCPPSLTGAAAGAAAVKRRHEPALFQHPGVVGVGVGRGPAIEVYLAQESAQARGQIPPQLEALPVRIIVTGEFEAW
jgi:hypothetical protein